MCPDGEANRLARGRCSGGAELAAGAESVVSAPGGHPAGTPLCRRRRSCVYSLPSVPVGHRSSALAEGRVLGGSRGLERDGSCVVPEACPRRTGLTRPTATTRAGRSLGGQCVSPWTAGHGCDSRSRAFGPAQVRVSAGGSHRRVSLTAVFCSFPPSSLPLSLS